MQTHRGSAFGCQQSWTGGLLQDIRFLQEWRISCLQPKPRPCHLLQFRGEADKSGNANDNGCSLASSQHLRTTHQKCTTFQEQQAAKRLSTIRNCQQKDKLRTTGCILKMLLSTTPDTGFCIFSPDWLEIGQAMEILRECLRVDLRTVTISQLDMTT